MLGEVTRSYKFPKSSLAQTGHYWHSMRLSVLAQIGNLVHYLSRFSPVMVVSYANTVPARNGIHKQKLDEHSASGIMFDVPNPESGVDPTKTIEDGKRAYDAFRQKRSSRSVLVK